MNVTFNLASLLNVLLAAAGLWTTMPELRGRAVKLWRIGLPPFFCTMTAVIMLATTEPSRLLEFTWLVAGLVGVLVGAILGSLAKIKTDQMWGLVQIRPAFLGSAAALGILMLACVGTVAVWLGRGLWPLDHDPAVAAALLSGFLDGRAWRMAAKAVRSLHADLNDQ